MKLSGESIRGSDFVWEWISIDEATKLNPKTERLAEKVLPTHMAIIVASFPYQIQLEEFKERLHLKTEKEVLSETVPNEKVGAQPRHSFAFESPLVQRRVVDVHGKALEEWKLIDLAGKSYVEFSQVNGMRFEPETPELKPVCFEGLIMPKMIVMAKNQYPYGEARLSDLQKTLAALKNAKADPTPEFCLIRLIDVTIEPGQCYQYRIKMRMANPNFGMKKVAKAADATREEPLESEWFEIRPKKDAKTQVVAMPQEYHLYTVDQQEIDNAAGKKYTGQNVGVSKNRQVAFQIHKWLECIDEGPVSTPIGEWSVAERVPAYRGEYIGRKQLVEVAYWRPTKEMFRLARESTRKSGTEVDFGPRIPEKMPSDQPYFPILVDFDGGWLTHYRNAGKDREDGKDVVLRIVEKAGVETLILSPDGKLLAENSWTDKADSERVKRLEEWRQRIDDVRNVKDTRTSNPDGIDPFSPKKMP